MNIADEIFEHALASFRAHDGLEAWLALVRASERGIGVADMDLTLTDNTVFPPDDNSMFPFGAVHGVRRHPGGDG